MYLRVLKNIVANRLGLITSPSFVSFFVTFRCNCKCIMCDVWKKKIQDEELSVPEIKKIFSQIKGIDVIRLSGGEPFLRNDLAEIIDTIDKASNPGVIHITTNGLLTKHIVETLKKIKNPKKVHIKISVDNLEKEHDRVRGVPAYKKAMKTIEELSKLRKKLGFFLGVNQTIVDSSGLKAYKKLKKVMKKYDVNVLPVIAYDASTGLYSDGSTETRDSSFSVFGDFKRKELGSFIRELKRDTQKVKNLKEKLLKRYQIKNMVDWLLKGKDTNPPCVALKSHMRILPNGDVPVCLYNSKVVGNLKKQSFKKIWFGKSIEKHRKWVRNCKGCRAGCEVNVSAIYTGDIAKGLL